MNLAKYRAEVRERVGVKSDDTALYSNVTVDRAINRALSTISAEHNWPWLFTEETGTTTANSPYFVPGGGWVRTDYLLVDGDDVAPAGRRDLARYRGGTAAVPRSYSWTGDSLVLSPTPNSAYAVIHGYWRSEPLLITDTDAPLLPDMYSGWAVDLAALELARGAANTVRVAMLSESINEWHRRAIDDVVRASSPGRIRRTKASIWQDV